MNITPPIMRPTASDEPIPGYRLIELIGQGGYGDVWKVSAPGGVTKAIKLIYDDRQSRGNVELRSLNRIKDVRHPFLLSIERIEQRPGMLTIVTELADKNLQQLWQACRDKGLPGVPQTELLNMLRDVAEALDYIYEEFALQHLDIKASNLLVFGKRLKVGDFGLVKNIYERTTNLVDGMTPAYAAPEVFSGKPSGASDQYSLAIVYQEMLTSTLPFSESTADRLALQHLHEVPNLRSLPKAQQPVVARALSKDPSQRFPSCTAFLEALSVAVQQSAAEEKTSSPESLLAKAVLAKAGYQIPSEPVASSRQSSASNPMKSLPRHGATESVPVARDHQSHDIAPTIVIGLGGTAARLLRQLRQRLSDRLGTATDVPAIKLMLIDTDVKEIRSVIEERDEWNGLQVVTAPLLTAADYREQGPKHRRWLSRRWLYNIPRNLSTDGLRPLGRLALLTNGGTIKTAVRTMIQQLTQAEASCIGQRRVAGPPRILFVSSISGGTGSGMLLDLAYAVRAELQLAGFSQGDVDALMLHSTPDSDDRQKAVLNAIAALRELAHYNTPGKFYPGEPLLGIPPFHGNNRTFSHAELLHLGDNQQEADWLQAIDHAAEFVFAKLTTPRGCLSPESETTHSSPVNVLQVRQIGNYSANLIEQFSQQLCLEIIQSWSGIPLATGTTSTSGHAERLVQTLQRNDEHLRYQQLVDNAALKVQEIGVDLEQLITGAKEKLSQEIATSEHEYLQGIYQQALSNGPLADAEDDNLAATVLLMQDRAIGLDFGERPRPSHQNTLFDLLHSRLNSLAMQLSTKFTNWIHGLVDHPETGVEGARCVADAGRNYIHDLSGSLAKEIREIHKQQIESRILLTSLSQASQSQRAGWWSLRSQPTDISLEDRLVAHGLLCFQELVLVCVRLQLQSIEAQASAVIDKLLHVGHELKELGNRYLTLTREITVTEDEQPTGSEQALWKLLKSQRHRLAKELRRRIDQHVFKGPKKFQQMLAHAGSITAQLREPLQHHSRQVVQKSLRQMLLILMQQEGNSADSSRFDMDTLLRESLQEPLTLGHNHHGEQIHVIVPAESCVPLVEQKLRDHPFPVQAIDSPGNNIAICRQMPGNSTYELAWQMAFRQPALMQLADNLKCRLDVAWEPLTEALDGFHPASVSESAPAAEFEIPGTICLAQNDLAE